MRRGLAVATTAAALAVTAIAVVPPQPARAVNIPSTACTVAGWFSGLAGKLCSAARAGGKLLGGHLGGAVGTLTGAGTATKAVTVAAVLAGVVGWVTAGAHAVLSATAAVIGASTRPQLASAWFSASYWRMAAIALLLTVPFLCAACVQAILRADPSLIARAALGYLPLAAVGIMIAAPLTTLLLSVSDGLGELIAGATGNAPDVALGKLAAGTVGLSGLSASTFVAFVIGFITVAAALTLWVELLIRAAAVYVIVLMLPVLFAALVWPARRVWAVRGVELLVALILSKFAIVAVLSLGGAAVAAGPTVGLARSLAGATLVLLAACSPWALMRLLPMHELAAGVEGLRSRVGGHLPLPEPREPGAAAAPEPAVAPGAGRFDAARTVLQGLDGSGGSARGERGPQAIGPDQPGAGGGAETLDDDARATAAASSGDLSAADPPAVGSAAPSHPRPAEPTSSSRVELPPDEFDKPTIILGPDLRHGAPHPGGFVPRPVDEPAPADTGPEDSEAPGVPDVPPAGPELAPGEESGGRPL